MPSTQPAILVVEDEPEVRETLSSLLSEGGFNVATASTGWEALDMLDEQPFDLAVADIGLPGGLDGLAMAQRARARHPELKCLFISGARHPVVCDPERDDFVAKPFRVFELIGCIWKVLQGNYPQPRLDVFR